MEWNPIHSQQKSICGCRNNIGAAVHIQSAYAYLDIHKTSHMDVCVIQSMNGTHFYMCAYLVEFSLI